jgi:hemoglobin-like flavoprotein
MMQKSTIALITQSLEYFAAHHGDPYARAYQALYAHDAAYEALFVLDSDEGLRRNMMRTTLEIIATYLDDPDAAANRIIGARMSHIPYGIETDFDVFFEITRTVISAGCSDIWTPDHHAAWTQMLTDFRAARLA